MSISVLIIDNHEVARMGLAQLLAGADVEIVGESAGGEQAVRQIGQSTPDVALLEIRFPDIDGFDLLEQLRRASPRTRMVVFSAFDNPTYVARALTLGASDYLLKGASRAELLAAIGAAHRNDPSGQSPLARRVSALLRSSAVDADSPSGLTVREFQVLRHLALGLSNKEIGQSLEISVETVKEHVQNILRKMQVIDRTQAAVEALKRGMV